MSRCAELGIYSRAQILRAVGRAGKGCLTVGATDCTRTPTCKQMILDNRPNTTLKTKIAAAFRVSASRTTLERHSR